MISPITYCEVPLYSQDLWTTEDYVELIDESRDLVDSMKSETGLDIFPSGRGWEYWEQYRNLWGHLMKNLCFAVACTFLIGTIAIYLATSSAAIASDTVMAVRVLKAMQGSAVMCVSIISTMTGVLGFMGLADIQMSAIPALTVIACMGICVDLTALVTLFFCAGVGSHDLRIRNALKRVFVPTLDSMTSTIVGCIALAFSPIELYVKYFFLMYVAVAVIGTFNGLVLLPVLLAWFGPSEIADSDLAILDKKPTDVESGRKGSIEMNAKGDQAIQGTAA